VDDQAFAALAAAGGVIHPGLPAARAGDYSSSGETGRQRLSTASAGSALPAWDAPSIGGAAAASDRQQQQQQLQLFHQQQQHFQAAHAGSGITNALLLAVQASSTPTGSPHQPRSPASAHPAMVAAQQHPSSGSAAAGAHHDQAPATPTDACSEPSLVRELGVTLASLERLFRAEGRHDYEQPVWMVVNLQGKIKGSYTADKMIEFCKRGTLSARQMVLGIDRDLPYVLRQVSAGGAGWGGVGGRGFGRGGVIGVMAESFRKGYAIDYALLSTAQPHPFLLRYDLSLPKKIPTPLSSPHRIPSPQDLGFYHPLGRLGVEVHAGGRYVPLSAARAKGPPEWAPVVPLGIPGGAPPGSAHDTLSASVATMALGGGGGGAAGAPGGPEAGAGPTSNQAALRVSLQRLFTPGGPGAKRQPMWLYVNHLGWCRGCVCGMGWGRVVFWMTQLGDGGFWRFECLLGAPCNHHQSPPPHIPTKHNPNAACTDPFRAASSCTRTYAAACRATPWSSATTPGCPSSC